MDQQKEKTNSSKVKSPVKRKSKHNVTIEKMMRRGRNKNIKKRIIKEKKENVSALIIIKKNSLEIMKKG